MKDERKTIPEMLQEIEDLRKQYGIALDHKLAASQSCTAILNNINAIQKLLDEAIVNLRKSSPSDSDWHRAHHSRPRTVIKSRAGREHEIVSP